MVDDPPPARLRFRPRPAAPSPRGLDGGRDEPLGLGEDRDGLLYVPDTAEPGAPVLVFLHGASGSGRRHLRAVLAAADRYGVVLVAPDSRHPATWDLIAEGRFGPDVAFLDRVLDAVADGLDLDVDLDRLAIGGVSDGASYALALGLSNGDVFGSVLAFSPGFLVVPAADRPPAGVRVARHGGPRAPDRRLQPIVRPRPAGGRLRRPLRRVRRRPHRAAARVRRGGALVAGRARCLTRTSGGSASPADRPMSPGGARPSSLHDVIDPWRGGRAAATFFEHAFA